MSTQATQHPRKTRSKLELLLGILLIGGFLLVGFSRFVDNIRDYLTRDSWVSTTATVVKINSKTHWLTYEYTVDGEQYIGTRLTITEDGDSFWGYPPEAENYPEGREIIVHYDPDRPDRVVISPTADFTEIALALFIFVGAIIGYFVLKRLLIRYLGWVGGMLSGNIGKQKD